MRLFWCNYLQADCPFFRAHGGWDFMATMLLSMREFSYSKKSMSSTESLLNWLWNRNDYVLPVFSLIVHQIAYNMAPQSLRFTAQKACHERVRKHHHSHAKATTPLHSSHHAHHKYRPAEFRWFRGQASTATDESDQCSCYSHRVCMFAPDQACLMYWEAAVTDP